MPRSSIRDMRDRLKDDSRALAHPIAVTMMPNR